MQKRPGKWPDRLKTGPTSLPLCSLGELALAGPRIRTDRIDLLLRH